MHQPYLNGRSVVLSAPQQVWSARDGQADGLAPSRGIEGTYCGDTRVLSQLLLSSPTHELEHVTTDERGGGRATYQYVLRTPALGIDPALVLDRVREATAAGIAERYRLTTSALTPQTVRLDLTLRPDATEMMVVKSGGSATPIPPERPQGSTAGWSWASGQGHAVLDADGHVHAAHDAYRLSWTVDLPPRGAADVGWTLRLADDAAPFTPCAAPPVPVPAAPEAPPSLRRLLEASFADLNALRLAPPEDPDAGFLAAGAPWYLTLFGRDSILSARNLLPHDLTLAHGTLRVLAGYQGTRVDPETAEEPGKIPHEIRRGAFTLSGGHQGQDHQLSLPPLYYGTIDATPLWILLLDDAERGGLPADGVRDLLPALRSALGWLRDHGDADGDGFLEYQDLSGHGLANQGWKDSGDSIRFADGSLATGSVALAETQGYAHAAALAGARLLERFCGDADAARFWRAWASDLRERFRGAFWAADALGRYPVLALDGDKRQVTGVASNMGHLLGTGILNSEEARAVVDRIMHPSMNTGYGVRTMSDTNGGYWPLSYHVGSVWTHDTAVIIDGLLREGFAAEARALAAGLLRAAEGFDHRLPELFGGVPADQVYPPQPYPASCRPQAWAATSAVVIARALGCLAP